jgi:GT2 family glycosyltransferase
VPEPSDSSGQTAPRLSVIVVSYNCLTHLRACLDSLAMQHELLPLQVIVVDNASADGTPAAVRDGYPWVELIASPDNNGFSWACNRGIERARGEALLFLNPDTVVRGDALRAATDELASRPEVGMLGVKLRTADGTLDHACKRGFPTPASTLYYFLGLARLFPTSRRFAQYTAGHVGEDDIACVDAVNGAFMLVRREALDQVGGLDEDYWLYMEDLDWCYRFWQAGWQVLYWPKVEVTHLKGGSSGKHRSWKVNHAFHRGMWLFYSKHYRSRRSPLVTAAVFAAVWTKLAVSATRSLLARRLRPAGSGGRRAA